MSFLENMAKSDEGVSHPDAMEDSGTCGECATLICMAQAARLLLETGKEVEDAVVKWNDEFIKLWHNSKYYLLYQQALQEKKNPADLFKEKGWEL